MASVASVPLAPFGAIGAIGAIVGFGYSGDSGFGFRGFRHSQVEVSSLGASERRHLRAIAHLCPPEAFMPLRPSRRSRLSAWSLAPWALRPGCGVRALPRLRFTPRFRYTLLSASASRPPCHNAAERGVHRYAPLSGESHAEPGRRSGSIRSRRRKPHPAHALSLACLLVSPQRKNDSAAKRKTRPRHARRAPRRPHWPRSAASQNSPAARPAPPNSRAFRHDPRRARVRIAPSPAQRAAVQHRPAIGLEVVGNQRAVACHHTASAHITAVFLSRASAASRCRARW